VRLLHLAEYAAALSLRDLEGCVEVVEATSEPSGKGPQLRAEGWGGGSPEGSGRAAARGAAPALLPFGTKCLAFRCAV